MSRGLLKGQAIDDGSAARLLKRSPTYWQPSRCHGHRPAAFIEEQDANVTDIIGSDIEDEEEG